MSKRGKIFFFCVCLLVGIGIVMTYSASAVYAQHVYDNAEHFLIRQCIYALIGTFVMFGTASIPIGFWQRHARSMIILSIVFLILVYIPGIGHTAGGAQRWIGLGVINFQPAEFAKITVCIYLSDYLSRKIKPIKKGSFFTFLPPLLLVGAVCVLTLAQPDLGSTAFMLMIVAFLFFLSGIRLRYVLTAMAAIVPFFYLLVLRVPYRASRVTAYLNPWHDPQGSGFQIIQSFIAFGLGGIHGVGLGQGIQKLFYLPSSYNDFIFSVIGEELGLIGAFFILAIYGIIFVCGIQMAEKSRGNYERFLIMALILMIVLQAIIHMLVTTGLIPTKGLPLPFVSFGGTSLVFNMMAAGLLLSADRQGMRGKSE